MQFVEIRDTMFNNTLLNISLFLFLLAIRCDAQEVEIPQGILSGSTRTNIDGGTYYAFKSIPYAKPPVGELRFRAPEPADGWEGVRDATVELPACRQGTSGQEDCLYLNVHTPGLPAEEISNLPVMVFIHGGAFQAGSGSEASFGAQFLLTKDVVLVTINYRLGLFGYLSLDDPNLGVPGNAGPKDQVLALQWVRDNIEYFGGDPNNVLLFGQSAGSMSVHLQLLSPMSAGLYHKAISESGTAFTHDVMEYVRNTAVLVAEYLGIQTDDWEAMLASLRELTTDELYAAQSGLTVEYPYLFRTTVEIESNEASFLNRWPIDIIEAGDFNQVPYINGVNNIESLGRVNGNQNEAGPIPDLTTQIPPDLEIESGSEAEQDIVQRFRDFYYGGGESTWDDPAPDVQLDTDYQFLYPHYRAFTGQLRTATEPIYFYYFSADTALNPKTGAAAAFTGAAHSDELAYLFYSSRTPDIEADSVEDRAIRNMVSLWTNFAIYGNPTPEGSDFIWEPMQEDQLNYLHIDTEENTLSVNLLPENMELWNGIYEDYYRRN